MTILPVGDAALLVQVDDLDHAHRVHAAVRALESADVVDVVPGERTVLVVARPTADLQRLAARLNDLRPAPRAGGAARTIEIPVVYDGEDLGAVAELTGLDAEEVVARHANSTFTVAYLGFSPGFGYLTGLDPVLRVPRLDAPRTAVPAGSVAIAGTYAAVYPSASPGGWRLLGHTDMAMWDSDRSPPALLEPGARVRFRPT